MLANGSGFDKGVIIFGADMSSSVHNDYKKKDILILGETPTYGLDDAKLTVEKEYCIKFAKQHRTFCFSLHYKGMNSYIFVNSIEIHKIKVKDSEIDAAPSILGNVSKGFLVDNVQKTGLCECVYNFPVDYDSNYVDDILDVRKYIIKNHDLQ